MKMCSTKVALLCLFLALLMTLLPKKEVSNKRKRLKLKFVSAEPRNVVKSTLQVQCAEIRRSTGGMQLREFSRKKHKCCDEGEKAILVGHSANH
jgi:hypothetical protein